MTRSSTLRSRDRTVVYGTTVGLSVNALLSGQLAYMKDQGWDVHAVSSPGPEFNEAHERERFTQHELPMSREISVLRDIASLLRWIRLLAHLRPAITNLSTPKAALVGTIAAYVTRVPRRIYVVRGLRLEGASGSLRLLLSSIERLVMWLSTDVIAVSHSLADALHEENLVPRRRAVGVIGAGSSNGVDANAVRAAADQVQRADLRRELGLDDKTVIGYLGRISSDKGVGTLADALAHEPLRKQSGWACLCVGGIEEPAAFDALKESGADLVHTPHTSQPWKYLAAMDILCLPTRREGFPNVVLEAAALGIPTVTTDATGAIDSVVDGATGRIVPVDDPATLASALSGLVDSEEIRIRMGQAAQRRIDSIFQQEHIWRTLNDLYSATPAANVTWYRSPSYPAGK